MLRRHPSPFPVADVLAYLFDPLVTQLAGHRIPRWGGSLPVALEQREAGRGRGV